MTLGVDSLTVFGMPPVEYVELVADLGCNHITTGLEPVAWRLERFAKWSLRENARLREELVAVLRDRGVAIALAEGLTVRPNVDARDRASDLDLFASLGAEKASAVSMEPDHARALDQLARLAELTAQRGMGFVIEFAPPHPVINTLDRALAAARHINQPHVAVLIDCMHFFRSGSSLEQLSSLRADQIGYLQLCDSTRQPVGADYYAEACFERKPPGDGELPLGELLRALPALAAGTRVGLEVPMMSRFRDAADYREVVGAVVEAGRKVLKERAF